MENLKIEEGMCVIGMDPSSYKNCGWAILQYQNGQVTLKHKFTQIFEYHEDELADPWNSNRRLREVYDKLHEMIQEYNIKYLCLERSIGGGISFVRGNLSETVGVAKLCCFDNNCRVFETSPCHVKKQVTGHGKAKKRHIQANVLGFFGLDESGSEHECDAACCALSFFMDAGWQGYKITAPVNLRKQKGKKKKSQNIKTKDTENKNVTKPANCIETPI